MSLYDPVFSDVVKDVIGNDPVLDQFDISYAASFYGTMMDDYITGTILTEVGRDRTTKAIIFATGSRGRAFSKYYASVEPPLDSTFGSSAVAENPSLGFRLTPWTSRVSRTAYRIQQLFDSQERYYDSCLPDLKKCFSVNSVELWTSNPIAKTNFSPVGNVVSASTGFMFFNSYKVDRGIPGYSYDPIVNNEWTWSYPYEGKYDPNTRILKTTNALGLSDVDLVGNYGILISDIEDFIDVFGVSKTRRPVTLKGFFPVLPGYLDKNSRPTDARNSLRSKYVPPAEQFDLLFQTGRIPASYAASSLDDVYGVSLLVPADVNLSKKESHDWFSIFPNITIPGAEYVTGTMTLDDTVRFMFGFGDLNNMTYGFRTFNSGAASTSYSQDFERSNPADSRLYFADDVPTDTSTYLTVNWSNSPSTNPWQYVIRDGTTGAPPLLFNHISGTSPFTGVGINWLDNAGTQEWVLLSDTTVMSGGNLPATGYSLACVDITSSVPWSLKYDRGIAADTSAYFTSYFSGIPGYPSHELPLGPLQVVLPLEVITGSGPNIKYDILTQYNSETDGVLDSNSGKTVAGTGLFPFPPGAWRLNFSFVHTGGPVGLLGCPDLAAIKNLQIKTFATGCFPPDTTGQKLGGNNYPQFRSSRCDTRYNSLLGFIGATNFQVTASAEIYKSFVFGVSPVIRGWKYGLFSGFPTHSKVVFRRDRYGQFRDMLEQRQYTKFIKYRSENESPTDNDATSDGVTSDDPSSRLRSSGQSGDVLDAAVTVNFVRRSFRRDARGIGTIYSEGVSPELTTSQNLSVEVTSSLPYFDGVAKHRQDSDIERLITGTTLVSLQTDSNGFTQVT